MNLVYDVIVIGARCAGSPLAMLLARQGHTVLLVDRSEFPSDRMSTHYVKRTGVALLDDWGLLESVMEIGTPRIRRQAMHLGDMSLCGSAPAYRGVDADLTPRRLYLDKILLDAACSAGAEVRDGFSATGLVHDDGRVVGVRGSTKGGRGVVERARVVVGADGVNSFVARNVGARTRFDTGGLTCAYYAYFSGMRERDDTIDLHFLEEARRVIITFPTNDDLDVVFVFWPEEEAARVQSDREGAFFQALDHRAELAERVRSGTRASRYSGTPFLPNFFRESHGPGWALVGDAAMHRDPLTAQGITTAFAHAQVLAEELGSALAGDKSLKDALASYDERQFEQFKPMFDFTVALARLQPFPPPARELLAGLRDSQDSIDAYLGAFVGSVPLDRVYPPSMLQGFAQGVDELAHARERAADQPRNGRRSPSARLLSGGAR